MESRSRKRHEEELISDQLPSDKRVCSSNSTPMNSSPDCEMEATSSSASVSGRSENENENEVNTDSDELEEEITEHRSHSVRDYYRGRAALDGSKIKKIVSSLKEEAGQGSQLAGLTELCDVLSFCSEELPLSYSELLAPILVRLAKDDSNPEIMLLSVRCTTYLCDAFFESTEIFVRHDVVPALCARLMNIEYLDVAEQCLQALEKISLEHPVVCLEGGVIMAALSYIDFFSTSIQRVALSTIANICQKLPPNQTTSFMEAVPILCNLLQYEDQKLVENVATCLIKIVDRVKHSSEMLDELCKHGLIHRATHLIELNGRSLLSQSVYTGLIGLLCKLASGSVDAFKTLLELNISSTLKHILSTYDIARGMAAFNVGGEQCNQVHEFMKLLNELLPSLSRSCENAPIMSDKEKILGDHPELLQQFGVNILPVLIQVVNSGVNLYVCYCCLSIINKLVYFSGPDLLLEFVKDTNISSFLAAAFTRKDHHVLVLVLDIVENIMTKLPDIFLNTFIKEGVVYAIDALLGTPENCSESSSPTSSSMKLSSGSSQMPATRNVPRCLCYAFENEQSPPVRSATCKLEEDAVHTLAKRIRDSYFATESHSSRIGLTETLEKLRNLCALLTDEVVISVNNNSSVQQEDNLSHILGQIMTVLSAGEYMSTFEFIESGIVKSLLTYLSNDHYMKEKLESHDYQSNLGTVLNRLVRFARFSLSSTSQNWEGMPITVLIKKLQSSLSSLEDFPVILSHAPKRKNTHVNIPFGRSALTPRLRVHFVREEGEMGLCDYGSDVVNIEPCSTASDIEKLLLPKVSSQKAESPAKVVRRLPPEAQSVNEGCSVSSDSADAQNGNSNLSSPISEQAFLGEPYIAMGHFPVSVVESPGLPNIDNTPKTDGSSGVATSKVEVFRKDGKQGDCTTCPHESAPTKLNFYLKGKLIDRDSTLYQEILQQKVKEEDEVVIGPGFWTAVYQVTYGKAAEPKKDSQECPNDLPFSSVLNNHQLFWQKVPFFHTMLVSELKCGIEKSNPTYEILFLLRILEGVNRFAFHLISQEQKQAFSKGELQDLADLVVTAPTVPPIEFVNTKLTEKLEQQMRDPLAMSAGSMPSWCCQLMVACPYLFGFEAKRKYLRQVMLDSLQVRPQSLPQAVNNNPTSSTDRNTRPNVLRKKKFQVCRSEILDSAAKMMDQHARQKNILEVEYNEEVGSGLGPTMEFYTLVSHEFQKVGLGIWRGDRSSFTSKESTNEDSRFLSSPLGFFPRPLSYNGSNEVQSVEVMKKFVLLGQIVARTLQDGRVMDLLFSKAFYKLILDQELNVYDIHCIDPELGRTLLEFQALIERRKVLHAGAGTQFVSDLSFRNTRIEDLWLDFTLPGYPDYMLCASDEHKMVNIMNLEEYVSSIIDATVESGISRQVEAFKSGFNQVFPIENLRIFSEGELERLLCGEQDAWTCIELLEHVKFDHGYTASSEAIINLLEIIQEFDYEKKRAFLQFVTGAPRLPPGGLAALNPQLTVVRKHCAEWVDGDLPSVMTCANYLKLPPYSSKERMRERLLYAITEGQGSFHLS